MVKIYILYKFQQNFGSKKIVMKIAICLRGFQKHWYFKED